MSAEIDEVIAFWQEAGEGKWFSQDDRFDAEIRQRFEPIRQSAAMGWLRTWEATAEGSLALVILTDQFPRNLFRGSAKAYATDPQARAVAIRSLYKRWDRTILPPLRMFFYLPLQHSEDPKDQDLSVEMFKAYATETGDQSSLRFALLHRNIIRRFGRFPHRNGALQRGTTSAEAQFLADGGFAG